MLKTVYNSKKSLFITGVAIIAALSLSSGQVVHADSTSAATQPVSITALCRDNAAATAQWRIGNANPNAVTMSWDDAGKTVSVSVPYGYTTVGTSFDVSVPASSVTFHQAGQSDQTSPVSGDACTAPLAGCVDGYTRANLSLQWSPNGVVTVTAVNGAPLCDDVTVYLSAYTLPKTYDGSGLFDDSSIPQQKFSSISSVLKQGTTGAITLRTAVPDACTDYQLDAYYAPEITSVSYHGQGAQLIYGKIYIHTSTDCTPVEHGGQGGGQVLAASTTTPTPPATAVLADTGQSALLPALSAGALMSAAAFINFPIFSRVKKVFSK